MVTLWVPMEAWRRSWFVVCFFLPLTVRELCCWCWCCWEDWWCLPVFPVDEASMLLLLVLVYGFVARVKFGDWYYLSCERSKLVFDRLFCEWSFPPEELFVFEYEVPPVGSETSIVGPLALALLWLPTTLKMLGFYAKACWSWEFYVICSCAWLPG